jgi:transcriptional regulator with XRE-family HTH domain
MAKRGRINQTSGPVVDLTPEDRAEVRRLRKAMGLTQEQLGAKFGVSGGTISNMETGRSEQPRRETYLEVIAYLRGAKGKPPDDASPKRFKRVMGKFLELDLRGQESVEALIDSQLLSLKKST